MIKNRVVLAALLCVTAACQEDPITRMASPVTLVPAGTIQVLIQQDRQVTGDSAVFIVSIVTNGVAVAAYQGEVTFAPQVIQVTSVRASAASDGEYRVVNGEELTSGRIRFAVFAAEALRSTEAFRIVARLHGDLSASSLVGSVSVVGQADGNAVSVSQLRRSDGVYDVNTNAQLVR